MAEIFPSLIGNEKLKKLISGDIIRHTVNHAYIIEGPAGSGKHTFAKSFIKGLVCLSKDNVPCGMCPNCRKLEDGMFADIVYLNRGDHATISVDSVREMLETVKYGPNEDSDYKFYVVEEAEKMTPQAQNALLLTLEEPPQYAVFLLLTTDSNMLLETVRSRAITLRTELFSAEFVYKYLKEIPGYSSKGDVKLKAAASVSGGALGIAKEVLDGENKSAVISQNASKFVGNLVGGKVSENLIFVASLKYTRQEYTEFFGFCESAIRDLIAYKNGNRNITFYPDPEEASVLCRTVPLLTLVRLYEAFSRAKEDITSANANITLVLTHLAASAV